MKKFLLSVGIVVSTMSMTMFHKAHADGINKPHVYTSAPAPLNVRNYDSAPTVHYVNPSSKGMKIYSTACGSADTEICSGQFVSTGRVVLAGQAPAYVESVKPIIRRDSMTAIHASPVKKHVVKKAHDCNCHSDGHHKHHGKQQIQLDGNFTGGVGAGVSSNWSGGHGGVFHVQNPMIRSRQSVMYFPRSTYHKRRNVHRKIYR